MEYRAYPSDWTLGRKKILDWVLGEPKHVPNKMLDERWIWG